MLDAWQRTPARFREDANAEEALSIGYGGRVIAELAANGADAARAIGAAGHVAIDVVDGELRVANTGAPLDAAGVAALSALRASAKRDGDQVGHFGVGFTAVRALSDEPVVVSRTGSVRFSTAETARAIAELDDAALDAEVGRRAGQLPALRLPWPVAGLMPPAGFDTQVRLPLRQPEAAAALADSLTADVAMDLLWALPDLAVVEVPGYRVDRVDADEPGPVRITITERAATGPGSRAPHVEEREFRVMRASGTLPPSMLADRPVEERTRTAWYVSWIVPTDHHGRPAGMTSSLVGAPTPTDEEIGLPARLVGSLPVDESRSRIASGALTDEVVGHAARLYVDLVVALPPRDRSQLIPPVGFPHGEFDAALRESVRAALAESDFLVDAAGLAVRPGRAAMIVGVRGAAAACVAEACPGLLAWPDSAAEVERLRGIGVRVEPVSTATAALAQLDRPAEFWQTVYDGFADRPLDELADLPVPRFGGGTIVGPRGVLLPPPPDARTTAPAHDDGRGDWIDRAARLVPGLRLAAAGADHGLLRRLGAEPADAAAVLTSSALAAEITARYADLDAEPAADLDAEPASGLDADRAADDAGADDCEDFASLVLDLVGSTDVATDDVPLGQVPLTDTDGFAWPAAELMLPGAPLADVLSRDADVPVVARQWIDNYGEALLGRLGVRSGFGTVTYPLPPRDDADLDAVHDWWDGRDAGPRPGGPAAAGFDGALVPDGAVRVRETFSAISDLDLVDESAWPRAIGLIVADRQTREALRPTAFGTSYSAWWLSRYARVDGQPLRHFSAPGTAGLAGLYDPLPFDLPEDLCRSLGLTLTPADAARDPAEMLARWADSDRTMPPGRVPEVTAVLVDALADEADPELPHGVRVLTGTVADADSVAVLDHPMLAQVVRADRLVASGADPETTGETLDLPLASEEFCYQVDADARAADPQPLGSIDEAARCVDHCGRADLTDRSVRMVAGLEVHARDERARAAMTRSAIGSSIRVGWWSEGDVVYLDGSPDGVARAVAFLADRWPDRYRLAALARGDETDLAEAAFRDGKGHAG